MEFSLPELTSGQFSFGIMHIELCSSENAAAFQVGFSVDRDGSPIFGFDEGEWQEGWYVIGLGLSCRDPVFVDLNDPSLPIYMAMTGVGEWEESLISENYQSFMEALKLVEGLQNRYSDSDSVSDDEVQQFMINIQKVIGDGDLNFWGMFIRLEERDMEFRETLKRMLLAKT